MIDSKIYTNTYLTKNNTIIPQFSDGKTVESKYDPQKDVLRTISTITTSPSFFIVFGIGSGLLISNLIKTFPNSKIIAVESCSENIDFLRNNHFLKNIDIESVILTDIDSLPNNLVKHYIPAIYGNLEILEQRGWVDEYKELIPLLKTQLQSSLKIISADYSVQCHFGKIWQNNIMNNLKNLGNRSNNSIYVNTNNKIAAIIAAGPSLDTTINKIKDNICDYYIISTDTAYGTLIKNQVIPDLVISIDGQNISHNHFMIDSSNKTQFMFDLCSDHTACNYIISKNKNITYFVSGHPLSALANSISNNIFPQLYSGAGTVTITAVDLAYKLGFNKIEIFGADFAYSNGKSYCKGTYFDKIYNINTNKIRTNEYFFNKLLYRTELIKINNNKTTSTILENYKNSLEDYLSNNKIKYTLINNVYVLETKTNKELNSNLSQIFNYTNFIRILKNCSTEELKIPLLPYISWLRNNNNYTNKSFYSLLKLAQSHIVSYN